MGLNWTSKNQVKAKGLGFEKWRVLFFIKLNSSIYVFNI